MFNRIRSKKGFTMIELLGVIIIVGLLLLIAVPAINKQLNNFRKNYYSKLESSVKAAGQDYISDKKFAKPTKLLYSKVIPIKKLQEEKYIDEVVDYAGEACDIDNSYVVVVKTGDKDYEYHTCLKCSHDEYETEIPEGKVDYCDSAWLDEDDVDYDWGAMNNELLYVYYGTREEEIKDQVGLTYDVVKKNDKDEVIMRVNADPEDEDDILFPQNIGELVNANVNTIILLKYELPDGYTLSKEAVIYKHNAPIIKTVYASENSVTGKNVGDSYGYKDDEWAGKLKVSISFSNDDFEKILDKIEISGAEYYDSVSKKWIDTDCKTSSLDTKTCEWTINEDFNKDIKIRVVSKNAQTGADQKGDASSEYVIRVDATDPVCVSNDGAETWVKTRTVTQICDDKLSGCSRTSFSKTYPTNDDNNKKVGNISIFDNAGNEKACSANFYVDSTPPSSCVATMKNASGSSVSNNSTSKTDITYSVKGVDNETDASGIKTETWDVKFGTTSKGQLVNTNGLDNGTYTVTPTCTDNAGNTFTGETKTAVLEKEISISYDANGGTGTMADTACKFNQACTLKTNSFTRKGYIFAGWSDSQYGSVTYADKGSVTTRSAITLYAQWTPITYTIKFDGNGNTGGSTANITCTYDQNCTLPKNGFTKSGYDFANWTYSSNVYNPGANVKNLTSTNGGSVTFKAAWTGKKYTITYYLGNASSTAGSTKLGTSSCTYGSSCTLSSFSSFGVVFPYSSSASTSYSWEFGGWSTSQTSTTRAYENSAKFTYSTADNISLYAVGKRTFKFFSGVSPSTPANEEIQYWIPYSTSTSYMTSIKIPSATAISGWTFAGYKDGSSSATSGVEFSSSDVGKTVTPAYNVYPWNRALYTRTLTISYNGNGNTGGSTANTTATQYYNSGKGASDAAVSTPTFTLASNGFSKTGYTFSKWTEGSTSGTQYAAGASYNNFAPSVTSTSTTKTMYAKWGGKSYTITYYLGNASSTAGSTKLGTSSCTYGSSCTLSSFSSFGVVFPYSSSASTSYSWEFGGWSTSQTSTTRAYENSAKFTYSTADNISLYAVGKRTFKFFSGVSPSTPANEEIQYWIPYSTSTSYMTSIKIPSATAISGWTFAGYKDGSSSATSGVEFSSSDVGKTVTPAYNVYPWNRALYTRTLTISYNGNGNTGGSTANTTATQYYNSGKGASDAAVSTPTFTLASNGFSKTGYTFSKWTEGSTSGTQYAAGASYNNFAPSVTSTSTTKTMYAKWGVNTYAISYDANGGTGTMSDTSCDYDTSCTLRTNSFTKVGHKFAGWSTSSSGSVSLNNNSTTKITKSITLYAVWTPNTYTIKFDGNGNTGGSTTSITCKYGSNCTLPSSGFTKTGYDFANWTYSKTSYAAGSTVKNLTATDGGSVTFTAAWSAKSYTITYYLGNGTSTAGSTKLGTSTCKYNSSCTLKAFADLGGVFPYSSADTANTNYNWSFYGWGTSNSDTSRDYANSASFTYTSTSNLNLYAIGRKPFYFNTGIAPTASFKTEYQYWNPHSTSTSYLTSITIPTQTNISGWTFVGYRGGSSSASSTVTFAASTVGTTQTPVYTTYGTNRSVYKRTIYVSYNGNSSTSGSVSNTSATQYYSSGYGSSGANNGANVSSPTFTLASNSFKRTGYTFSKWAEGSASGTQYAAGASYSNFAPGVSSTSTTKTMYAVWSENVLTICYFGNGGTIASGYSLETSGTCNGAKKSTIKYSSLSSTYDLYNVATLFTRSGYEAYSSANAWRVGSASATTYYSQTSQDLTGILDSGSVTKNLYANWKSSKPSVSFSYTAGYVCPSDGESGTDRSSRNTDCHKGQYYNRLQIKDAKYDSSTGKVSFSYRLTMNDFAVSYSSGSSVSLCIAKYGTSYTTCYSGSLATWSPTSSNWLSKGSSTSYKTVTVDVSNYPAGSYKIIATGNSKFAFTKTDYTNVKFFTVS